MVTAIAEQPVNLKRWGGFLALSFAVNFYLLGSIPNQQFEIDMPNVERIRISLNALAAPAPKLPPKPVVQEAAKPAVTPPPVVSTAQKLDVETASVAETKIVTAKLEPKAEPKPELPVAKEVIEEAPQKIEVKELPITPPAPSPRIRPEEYRKVAEKPAPELTDAKPTPKAPVAPPQPEKIIMAEKVAPAPSEEVSAPSPKVESTAADNGNSISSVVHEANYRHRTPPVYPRRAYQMGQQGTVMLHALIGANGKPDDLKVETSSGHRLLDKAALVAVASWEFEPRIENGRKVQSWVRVPVKFIIR